MFESIGAILILKSSHQAYHVFVWGRPHNKPKRLDITLSFSHFDVGKAEIEGGFVMNPRTPSFQQPTPEPTLPGF